MKNDRVYILRESVVKITQMLSGKGIKVTQEGLNAFVKADMDGVPVLVNLPYLPDNAGEDLCGAIQGFLDHEVAHILFTEFTVMNKAVKHGKQTAFMLNVLEDPRIEKCMAERFAGCKHNLETTGKFFLEKYIAPQLAKHQSEGKSNEVVKTLIVPMIRAMSGQLVFKDYMADKWEIVSPIYDKIKDLAPRIESAKSTEDCLEIALEIKERMTSEPESGESSDEPSKDKDESKSSKGKTGISADKSSSSKSSSKGESGGEGDSSETEPSTAAESESESESEGEEQGGSGDTDDMSDAAEGSSAEEIEEESPFVPEVGKTSEMSESEKKSKLPTPSPIWDELDKDKINGYEEALSKTITHSASKLAANAKYLPFTKDFDLIEKLPVGKSYVPAMTTTLSDAVDHMVAPLQKDLERAVAARSLSTRSHGHRSGRLHSANLSRLAVNDSRVFSRKHESDSKDVAVELVVDASGSMSGGKIRTASQTAYALSSVLDRLNIKNEVICFTTKDIKGRESEMYRQQKEHRVRFSRVEGLYMPILKGYDERMTVNVKERFGWLPNASILRNNVDGECVEIAARRLMARREAGKIMIVLSDGEPAAAGSSSDLQQHLKATVKEIEKAGVKVVGIGIDSSAVRDYYSRSIVLNNVADLPTTVIKELRQLLLKAN